MLWRISDKLAMSIHTLEYYTDTTNRSEDTHFLCYTASCDVRELVSLSLRINAATGDFLISHILFKLKFSLEPFTLLKLPPSWEIFRCTCLVRLVHRCWTAELTNSPLGDRHAGTFLVAPPNHATQNQRKETHTFPGHYFWKQILRDRNDSSA